MKTFWASRDDESSCVEFHDKRPSKVPGYYGSGVYRPASEALRITFFSRQKHIIGLNLKPGQCKKFKIVEVK